MRHKAAQHKLPYGRTRVFPDVEPELVHEIDDVIGKAVQGRPILVHVDSLSRWTLLTTREVLSCDNSRLARMKIEDIGSVGTESSPPSNASSKEVARWKSTWERLRLVDRQGVAAIIWVPGGPEAYAIWNILLPYARGNA